MLLACFATSAVDGLYPERAAVDRDLLRRSYGIVPYMLAKLVLDGMLLRALPACAFGIPFYWCAEGVGSWMGGGGDGACESRSRPGNYRQPHLASTCFQMGRFTRAGCCCVAIESRHSRS
jgi:hypothetical protein